MLVLHSSLIISLDNNDASNTSYFRRRAVKAHWLIYLTRTIPAMAHVLAIAMLQPAAIALRAAKFAMSLPACLKVRWALT